MDHPTLTPAQLHHLLSHYQLGPGLGPPAADLGSRFPGNGGFPSSELQLPSCPGAPRVACERTPLQELLGFEVFFFLWV
ncbi:hypothetical protein H8959_006327 [Pygathrix nigripes]